MYDDDAEGLMDDSKDPASIELIVLRPRIWATGATEERVLKLVDQAHRHCYVANSLRTEIRIEPTVEIR
jgi:organic hydroperoxide reductase OsmC/OhrA